MRTEKQIEASRRNGAKSKGPVTPEGKAKSSRNATLHGLASVQAVLLSNEDESYYKEALDRYIARFQPADHTELELVEMMAAASWRMRRAAGLEVAMFNVEMERQREAVDAEYEQVGDVARQYLAFEAIAQENNRAILLHRYELRALRCYNSALRNLLRLQADRKLGPAPVPAPVLQTQTETQTSEPRATQELAEPNEPETSLYFTAAAGVCQSDQWSQPPACHVVIPGDMRDRAYSIKSLTRQSPGHTIRGEVSSPVFLNRPGM